MTYTVYITRTDNWRDAKKDPITLEAWEDLIHSIPQMHPAETGASGAQKPKQTAKTGLARWSQHPHGYSVWFEHRDGYVLVENPDPYTISRMKSLANRLGASVRSDEGKPY